MAKDVLLRDLMEEQRQVRRAKHKERMASFIGAIRVPTAIPTVTPITTKEPAMPTANPNDGEKIYGGKAWGGSQNIVRYAEAVAKGQGVPLGSAKRGRRSTASGNTSDHFIGATKSYARDLPVSGKKAASLAHAIARKLGVRNYSTGNFNHYNITDARGRKFRVQILWDVAGHRDGDNPHVHVGVKRVG